MRIVIRIGGSVIASPPNPELIRMYAEMLTELRALGHRAVVVVGGGSMARDFIGLAHDAGLNEAEQDEIAISISRVFAQILAVKFGGLELKRIPRSTDETVDVFEEHGFAFMGGLKPGMTTDTVAAMTASRIQADLIVKATDQDGIYAKDPRKYPDARKLDELRFSDLFDIFKAERHKVGIHQILDPEALRLLQREKIETVVVNGFKPENILSAIRGEKIGTRIR